MANTAHVYEKSGRWYASFNHPVVKSAGNVGKKIHRGLRADSEAVVRTLEVQLNTLLREETFWELAARKRAEAAGFAATVIAAFYDCMNTDPIDYLGLRNDALPLPPNVPVVQTLGNTGVGKTQLIQHLMGTASENLPMRGASRTTVADVEVIVANSDFEGVVTFFSQDELRAVIEDNVWEACCVAYNEPDNESKVANRLLVDVDSRFRLNFLLGTWRDVPEDDPTLLDDDETTLDSDDPDADEAPFENDEQYSRLVNFVRQIICITSDGKQRAIADLKPAKDEDVAVVDEHWFEYADQSAVDTLVSDLMQAIEDRLQDATGSKSWPKLHRVGPFAAKSDFIQALQLFYQNKKKLFGRLLTPVVQGMRLKGRFYPVALNADSDVPPSWVLLDGQGLGHEVSERTDQNSTLPPEITRKFGLADVICLVDMAKPAMIGDAPLVVSEIAARGYQDKLALVFTHFESVNAPNLDTVRSRKDAVLKAVSSTVQMLPSLSKQQKITFEKNLAERSFFLSNLNKKITEKARLTRNEFGALVRFFLSAVQPPHPITHTPAYNRYRIAQAVEAAIASFRNAWASEQLAHYHWKVMEALTNWVGNSLNDGYPKRNLFPAADLSRRVMESLSPQLEEPEQWMPSAPADNAEYDRIINAVRAQTSIAVDAICRRRIVQEPRVTEWEPAYRTISGYRTKARRARQVARILEDGAPMPAEGLGDLADEIWAAVSAAAMSIAVTTSERGKRAA